MFFDTKISSRSEGVCSLSCFINREVLEMKKLGILVAAAMFLMTFSSMAMAVEEADVLEGETQPAIEVSAEVAFFSAYVGDMTGTIFWRELVVQPGLTIEHKSGAYAYVWGSLGRDFNRNCGTEVDGAIGYSKEVIGWTLNAEYAYYACSKLGRADDDIHSVHFNVDAPEAYGVTAFFKIEGDQYVNAQVYEDDDGNMIMPTAGWLWGAGLRTTVDVAERPIDFELYAGGNDGAYEVEPAPLDFGRITVSMTFEAGSSVEITPTISWQQSFHREGLSDDILYGGVIVGF